MKNFIFDFNRAGYQGQKHLRVRDYRISRLFVLLILNTKIKVLKSEKFLEFRRKRLNRK